MRSPERRTLRTRFSWHETAGVRYHWHVNLKTWAARKGISYDTACRRFHEGTLPVPARRLGRLIIVDEPESAARILLEECLTAGIPPGLAERVRSYLASHPA